MKRALKKLQAAYYARARNVAYRRATEYFLLGFNAEGHVLNLDGDRYHNKFLKAIGAFEHPVYIGKNNAWVDALQDGGYEYQ
jgi:hypothetical protein